MIRFRFVLIGNIICSISLCLGMGKIPLYFNLLPPEVMQITEHYILHNSVELQSILSTFKIHKELENFLSKSNIFLETFRSSITKTDQKTLSHILSCKSLPPVTDPDYFNMVLFNSVRSNNASMIKLLLYLGANKEFQNQDSHDPALYYKTHYTLLAHAAEWGYVDATSLLLQAGANPNPHDSRSNILPIPASPLICALQGNTRNTSKIVELLLNAGAKINLPDKKNQTALSFVYNNPALSNSRKAHEILKKHEQNCHKSY